LFKTGQKNADLKFSTKQGTTAKTNKNWHISFAKTGPKYFTN